MKIKFPSCATVPLCGALLFAQSFAQPSCGAGEDPTKDAGQVDADHVEGQKLTNEDKSPVDLDRESIFKALKSANSIGFFDRIEADASGNLIGTGLRLFASLNDEHRMSLAQVIAQSAAPGDVFVRRGQLLLYYNSTDERGRLLKPVVQRVVETLKEQSEFSFGNLVEQRAAELLDDAQPDTPQSSNGESTQSSDWEPVRRSVEAVTAALSEAKRVFVVTLPERQIRQIPVQDYLSSKERQSIARVILESTDGGAFFQANDVLKLEYSPESGDNRYVLRVIKGAMSRLDEQAKDRFDAEVQAKTDAVLRSSTPLLPVQVSQDVAKIQADYEQHEREAARIAAELQSLATAGQPLAPEAAKLDDQLQRAVANAFDGRVELQRAQLANARQDLALAEARIVRRLELREKIIARRVEELATGEDTAWSKEARSEFNGKALDAWLRLIANELNLARLDEAMQAISVLGSQEENAHLAAASAAAVFEIVGRYQDVEDGGEVELPDMAFHNACSAVLALPHESIAQTLVQSAKDSELTMKHVYLLTKPIFVAGRRPENQDERTKQLAISLLAKSNEREDAIDALIQLAEVSEGATQVAAVELLRSLFWQCREVLESQPRLEQALLSSNIRVKTIAVTKLVHQFPQSTADLPVHLATCLATEDTPGWQRNLVDAALTLQSSSADMQPVVPALAKLLSRFDFDQAVSEPNDVHGSVWLIRDGERLSYRGDIREKIVLALGLIGDVDALPVLRQMEAAHASLAAKALEATRRIQPFPLLETVEQVETRLREMIEERKAIANAHVRFRCHGSGAYNFNRLFSVFVNDQFRRVDCRGVGSDGNMHYTAIATPDFVFTNDRNTDGPAYSAREVGDNDVGSSGAMGDSIPDIRKIGWIAWHVESVDSHGFEEQLLNDRRRNIRVDTMEVEGETVTVVKFERSENDKVKDAWAEYWLAPSQGNYPVYIAYGWTLKQGENAKYVVSQKNTWKEFSGIWYPKNIKYKYACSGQPDDANEVEVIDVRFNLSPFPKVFSPEVLLD